MRNFKSGATRNDEEGKYDYEGFLSPLVVEAYAKYMHKHRLQADGKLRDSDNWQKGFGENHFAVCIKSLYRHFIDFWKEHRGLKSREGLDDAIGGILFNVMAYYHKILEDREKKNKLQGIEWDITKGLPPLHEVKCPICEKEFMTCIKLYKLKRIKKIICPCCKQSSKISKFIKIKGKK